jgi:hypothetical protein
MVTGWHHPDIGLFPVSDWLAIIPHDELVVSELKPPIRGIVVIDYKW